MKQTLFAFLMVFLFACNQQKKVADRNPLNIDSLATAYVKLALNIGQYDTDFVDAYYGPDSLKPAPIKDTVFPKEKFLTETGALINAFDELSRTAKDTTIQARAEWLKQQTIAFARRIKIFSGEYKSFDEESKELFGVQAPSYPESHYQAIIASLDSSLPGSGKITDRIQQLSKEFVIPKNKLDTVFKAAIAEARRRTLEHYALPANETFRLEYVSGKPWSGYNWYKGNYESLIQISNDVNIYIERAIDLACHEGYPGHHVYNAMLEQNLYRSKGRIEISLYPLFSPQSLIAEGSANYGISVAFPGKQRNEFAKKVLMPLAGIDTTHADLYFNVLDAKGALNYARNEACRGLLSGKMNEQEVLRWLKEYGLYSDEAAVKSISFMRKYRSYIINYNYGQDLVKHYIESGGGTESDIPKRWELFGALLSNQVTTAELSKGYSSK